MVAQTGVVGGQPPNFTKRSSHNREGLRLGAGVSHVSRLFLKMKIKIVYIGDFTFQKMKEDLIIVFHPRWDWQERFKKGKRIIRLKAK